VELPPASNKDLAEFRSRLLPEKNVYKDVSSAMVHLPVPKNKLISAAGHLLGADQCTNAILYPAMSIMAWHTNADMPGIRTYYTYTEGRAIFRYYLDGEYHEDEDNIGWTARQFIIDPKAPLWHTVWTEKPRYAFGFNTTFKH
jgi:hypothetical protein